MEAHEPMYNGSYYRQQCHVIPGSHRLACSNCVDSHLPGEVRLELSLPSRSAEAVGRARESDRDRGGVTAGVTVMGVSAVLDSVLNCELALHAIPHLISLCLQPPLTRLTALPAPSFVSWSPADLAQ